MLDGRSEIAEQSMAIELVLAAVLLSTVASLRIGQRGGILGAVAVPALILIIAASAWIFERPLGLLLFQRNLERGLEN